MAEPTAEEVKAYYSDKFLIWQYSKPLMRSPIRLLGVMVGVVILFLGLFGGDISWETATWGAFFKQYGMSCFGAFLAAGCFFDRLEC